MKTTWKLKSGSVSDFSWINEALLLMVGFKKLFKPILRYIQNLSHITTSRGLEEYLNGNLNNLSCPYDLPNMKEAVAKIKLAIQNNSKIIVYGDYDADGVTATAILVRALRHLGAKVDIFIPNRHRDGYGITIDAVESCIQIWNPALIITVDCGINAIKTVDYILSKNVDAIITDHHEPDVDVVTQVPVVNPKIDKENKLQYLAGCGVAYYLIRALSKEFPEYELNCHKYLDITAIGTVADMVPLIGDNRIIVKYGLKQLEKTEWPGIKHLLAVCKIKTPTSSDIGFKIAPRINAAGRLESAMTALHLFLDEDEDDARNRAVSLDHQNLKRRELCSEYSDKAKEEVYTEVSSGNMRGIVVSGSNLNSGIVGIIASNLMYFYGLPAIVLAVENGKCKGSCRSIPSINMLDALKSCSDLLTRYGGHVAAAGLELPEEKLPEFKRRFNEYVSLLLANEDVCIPIEIDSLVDYQDISWEFLSQIEYLQPFGAQNKEPVWGLKNVMVISASFFGTNHLRMTINLSGKRDGTELSCIQFNSKLTAVPCGKVDVAFRLQKSTYNDITQLQLVLVDVHNVD